MEGRAGSSCGDGLYFRNRRGKGQAGEGQTGLPTSSTCGSNTKLKQVWKQLPFEGHTRIRRQLKTLPETESVTRTSLDQMPSRASHEAALRPCPLSWALSRPQPLTACPPAALASSLAGLGLHPGCHHDPGHRTHLGQHRPCHGLSAASAAVVPLAHGPWRPPPAPCR